MKKQVMRIAIQILGLGLTVAGFFINFKFTMAIIVASMVVGGTFYCGWICPYGSLQEFANKLARVLRIKQRKMPKAVHKYLKFSRYIIFVCASLLSFSFIFEILALDPRNNFLSVLTGTMPSILALVVLISFILLSMVYERFFCKYLCFEGAKFGLMSMFRPVTIRRDKDKCIECGKCDRVCSMSIEVSKFEVLRSPNCINCFKCVETCPVDDTLTYGFKSKKMKRTLSIAAILLIAIAIPSAILIQNLNSADAFDNISLDDLTIIEDIKHRMNDSDKSLETTGEIEANVIIENNVIESDDAEIDHSEAIKSTPIEVVTQLYKDGTYTGAARGFRGNIYVEVTVEADVIKEITVSDHREDRRWYNRAVSIIDDMLNSQSTDVDLVGGATYSSEGIRDAVEEALEKAK